MTVTALRHVLVADIAWSFEPSSALIGRHNWTDVAESRKINGAARRFIILEMQTHKAVAMIEANHAMCVSGVIN
jgi:hypothetical protein